MTLNISQQQRVATRQILVWLGKHDVPLLFGMYFAIVMLVFSIGFFHLKLPHDSAYYLALANSLLKSGNLLDISSAPPGSMVSLQIGIVFVLAGLMWLFDGAWFVGHVAIVAAIWTWSSRELYRLGQELLDSNAFALLIPAASFLQFDNLNVLPSLVNEALFIPAFYGVFAKLLYGALQKRPEFIFDGNSFYKTFLYLFLIFGAFFRIHFVLFLACMFLFFMVYGRRHIWKLVACGVISGALLVLVALYQWNDKMTWVATMFTNTAASEILRVQFAFTLSTFDFYLYLPHLFGYGSLITILGGVVGLSLFLFGLQRLWRRSSEAFLFVALFCAASSVFYLSFSYFQPRYYMLTNLPVLCVLLFGLKSLLNDRQFRWLTATGVAAAALAMAVNFYYYMSSRFDEVAFSFVKPRNYYNLELITAYEVFRSEFNPADYLVYAQEHRHTYGMLGVPGCVAKPTICAESRGVAADTPAVYIGHKARIPDGRYGLRGGATLNQSETGFGVWLLEPISGDTKAPPVK